MHQSVRIPSDGYIDPNSGQAVHEGEWVEIWPTLDIAYLRRFKAARESINALPTEGISADDFYLQAFDVIAPLVAERVKAWNWTGRHGPLPPLDGTTTPLEHLSYSELMYLWRVQQEEPETDRGNASAPSPSTTSEEGAEDSPTKDS